MKRFVDIILSLLILLITSPVMLLLMLLKLNSSIFFYQTRPGLNGEPFVMVKFKTMTSEKDEKGKLLPDEKRLTQFGKFLRFSSLDELPELWNVLKGDMSLVGPRPLLMEYLPLYSEEQMRRHEVRPGITGWAQVNGRNAISWEKKFQLDVWYVNNQSLWLDIKILIMTVKRVLNRDGIVADGSATAEKFKGNSS